MGMLRAKPRTPVCWKYGMLKMLAAMTATESEGFTKKPCLPRIMFRSFGRRETQSKTFQSNSKQKQVIVCGALENSKWTLSSHWALNTGLLVFCTALFDQRHLRAQELKLVSIKVQAQPPPLELNSLFSLQGPTNFNLLDLSKLWNQSHLSQRRGKDVHERKCWLLTQFDRSTGHPLRNKGRVLQGRTAKSWLPPFDTGPNKKGCHLRCFQGAS